VARRLVRPSMLAVLSAVALFAAAGKGWGP
jgi:hypothetical protein